MPTPVQMDTLVDTHLKAELTGDLDGAVAVYTDDIEHDDVGFPGPLVGKAAARAFYQELSGGLQVAEMRLLRRFHAGAACVTEHLVRGRAVGTVMGISGRGRRVEFRMLHIFEFRDGLISRENTWIDGAAVAQQLT